MFYVYSKYLKSGREDYVNSYPTPEDAIHKIAQCYKINSNIGQLGEYYYFMIKR